MVSTSNLGSWDGQWTYYQILQYWTEETIVGICLERIPQLIILLASSRCEMSIGKASAGIWSRAIREIGVRDDFTHDFKCIISMSDYEKIFCKQYVWSYELNIIKAQFTNYTFFIIFPDAGDQLTQTQLIIFIVAWSFLSMFFIFILLKLMTKICLGVINNVHYSIIRPTQILSFLPSWHQVRDQVQPWSWSGSAPDSDMHPHTKSRIAPGRRAWRSRLA